MKAWRSIVAGILVEKRCSRKARSARRDARRRAKRPVLHFFLKKEILLACRCPYRHLPLSSSVSQFCQTPVTKSLQTRVYHKLPVQQNSAASILYAGVRSEPKDSSRDCAWGNLPTCLPSLGTTKIPSHTIARVRGDSVSIRRELPYMDYSKQP